MSKVDRRAQLIVNIKVEHTKQSQYLNISGKTDCHHKSRPHSPVSIRFLGISQPSYLKPKSRKYIAICFLSEHNINAKANSR